MMKKALILAMLGLVVGCDKVPAGNVGIKVYLLGSDKGVDVEELPVGMYWIGVNEELYLFPTFVQNYVWTKDESEGSKKDESITFQTVEGLSVNADVGISYYIKPDRVPDIFQRYRRGVDEITDVFLRNMVRDAFNTLASSKPVESVYGTGKADLMKEVEKMVHDQVVDQGIVVEKIYLVGDLRLPNEVINSISNKIRATQEAQQRQNEVATARAEADKIRAEANGKADAILSVATAQAEANRLLAQSLTNEVISYKALETWNGVMPQFISGENSSPSVLFSIKQ